MWTENSYSDQEESFEAISGRQNLFGFMRISQTFFLVIMPLAPICLIRRARYCGVMASNWATSQFFKII